jgi:hypothetical protein
MSAREMSAAALANLAGWSTPLARILPRLRCSKCQARRAHIGLVLGGRVRDAPPRR